MKNQNLVFLHGFPFNASSWNGQIEYFKNKFNVFAPDLLGHGNGSVAPGPWMIAHFVDELEGLFQAKRLEKAVICGLSMGGYIALHFARQYPGQVSALVLCDTQADPDSNETKDKRYLTIEKIRREGLSPFSQDFSKAVLSENTLKEKPQIQQQLAQMITSNKSENVRMTLGALASRLDSNPFLPTFKFPTLVLVGADDKITPPALSRKIADGIKGSTLHVIEQAGHLSNLEQPDVFNKHLEIFLNAIAPREIV